jgi:hypothetical protein
LRLEAEIAEKEFIINTLRNIIGDEDKCDRSILAALKKRLNGAENFRELNKEKVKREIIKFKNISLKIIKDYRKNGFKIPGFTGKLALEMQE